MPVPSYANFTTPEKPRGLETRDKGNIHFLMILEMLKGSEHKLRAGFRIHIDTTRTQIRIRIQQFRSMQSVDLDADPDPGFY
jgi:hypothetical protein